MPNKIPDIFSFGIPFLIIGNKSDSLVKIKDEKALDYIQFTLRNFALKYGASVMFTSTSSGTNVNCLVDFLS